MEFAREAAAVLPDSGRVWWKAQMRARREAVEAVGRPITAIQVVAFTCGGVVDGGMYRGKHHIGFWRH